MSSMLRKVLYNPNDYYDYYIIITYYYYVSEVKDQINLIINEGIFLKTCLRIVSLCLNGHTRHLLAEHSCNVGKAITFLEVVQVKGHKQ